jgi:hypothetical protein
MSTTSIEAAAAEPSINPLSAAFDAALAGSGPAPASTLTPDFIGTTLAMLDDPGTGTAPAESTPAPEAAAEPADPLAAIDDAYPDSEVDGMGDGAKVRWGEVKAELKAERRAAYALKQELEQLKQKSLYDPTEVDGLKQQIEEFNRELSVHRIEATSEYKQAIDAPLMIIGEAAASVARRYEIDQDALFDALANTDEAKQQKELTDLVDGMSDRDRLKIYQMADDTLTILNKRNEMKARSHEAMQELEIRQRQTAERSGADHKREFSSHMDRLFESLEDKLPFHPLDPNESKSAVMEQLKRDALLSDVRSAGTDVQAYSAAAGVVLPRLIKQFRALAAENSTLKTRLSSNSAASPTKARQTTPSSQAPAGGNFLDNIFSQLPG